MFFLNAASLINERYKFEALTDIVAAMLTDENLDTLRPVITDSRVPSMSPSTKANRTSEIHTPGQNGT
jgi:hypothetical protein